MPLDCFVRLNYSNFFAGLVKVIIGAMKAILTARDDNSTAFTRYLECRVRIQVPNLSEPSFCYSTSRDGSTALVAKVTTCQRTVFCTDSLRLADLSVSRI